MTDIKIYNTATRDLEIFKPLIEGKASLYHCGPTVYNYAHIGNMRAYVFADTLRRMLEWNGYEVNQVINITDVGHLVSDSDDGEDKMALGARREGLNIEEIIKRYSDAFYNDLDLLNIKRANVFPRATEHIKEQIQIISELEKKGYTYTTSDGVYFDTSRYDRYADFAKLDIKGLQGGERIDLGEKRNKTDFALWKFYVGDGDRLQEWDSPWGKGFPGWHIECSAMSMKYLGETLDIHTGGVDHINIHHTNEIAQSECATGHKFSNYWMHCAFMNVDNQKMSKSLGNTYRVGELEEKFGITPLAYRYWLMTSHYRTQTNFTVEAVKAAEVGLTRLKSKIVGIKIKHEDDGAKINTEILNKATEYINDDLNTAKVIALLFEIMSEGTEILEEEKYLTIMKIDEILGLNLANFTDIGFAAIVPSNFEYSKLLEQRRIARESKNWQESDRIRDELSTLGYLVKDTENGQEILKK
jgi:cysteinyl-tRNA synthetase